MQYNSQLLLLKLFVCWISAMFEAGVYDIILKGVPKIVSTSFKYMEELKYKKHLPNNSS